MAGAITRLSRLVGRGTACRTPPPWPDHGSACVLQERQLPASRLPTSGVLSACSRSLTEKVLVLLCLKPVALPLQLLQWHNLQQMPPGVLLPANIHQHQTCWRLPAKAAPNHCTWHNASRTRHTPYRMLKAASDSLSSPKHRRGPGQTCCS